MKTVKVLLIAVTAVLVTGPAVAVVLAGPVPAYSVPAEHPRILITKKTLPELLRRAKGPFAKEYAYAKQRADRALKSGAQFINNKWAKPTDLLYLGLAYLVERESGKRKHR